MTDPTTGPPDQAAPPRTALFIAGAGRSGTSTLAGLMQILGLRVPQPEVAADESNPKGFGEPQWAVDFHTRLLREVVVQVSDSRPDAWFDTAQACVREPARIRAAQWLEEHYAAEPDRPELVIKDPRLSWFLPLWRVAAIRSGARPVFATTLRPPAEVVLSKQTYYANRLGAAHLTASWLNMMLHTERATRPVPAEPGDATATETGARVFVRYADLLDDWVRITQRVGTTLDLRAVQHATSEQVREGHRFVDPTLRRMDTSLADLDLPARLRTLTEETWTVLDGLVEPDGDRPEAHATLDELREAYVDLYSEAEAISRSTVVATEHRIRAKQPAKNQPAKNQPAKNQPTKQPGNPPSGKPAAQQPAAETAAAPPAPESAADRLPHGLRAMVPGPVRRGVRRALGRERSAS